MFEHDRLDPRSKLALTTSVVIAAIAWGSWSFLGALLGFVVFVVIVGRGYGLGDWVGSIAPILYILPLLVGLNTLFYAGGTSIVTMEVGGWVVGVTTGGIDTAGRIALRLLVIAGVAAWFAATTGAEAFEVGLVELGVPWTFAFLLSLTIRLVPEMRHRFTVIEQAQRSRGLRIEGGPITKARARIPMFLPFLSAIIRYGYELSDALTARGFDRIDGRTSYVEIGFERWDGVVVLVAILLLAVVVVV